MKNLLRRIFKRRHHDPLIKVHVSEGALRHNLREFMRISNGASVAPVLKSNAYGHALVEVARIMDQENVPFLVVDSYFEALTLRNNGIRHPLLVLGYTRAETILENHLKSLSFTITNLDTLLELSKKATEPLMLHVKFDTGMNRQGLRTEEFGYVVEAVRNNKNLKLLGVASHFADADSTDPHFTRTQIKKWNQLVENVENEIPGVKYFHISATSGHAYLREAKANVTRLGLGLYGVRQGASIESKVDLKPALTMTTIVSGTKEVLANEKIGYGITYTARGRMRVATIPVGYFEGIDRRLSNKGFVKIHGQFAPIVGRVSMNITVVDVTHIAEVAVNDEVEVISAVRADSNSVESMARLSGTITHEILIHIPAHLARRVEK